MDLNSFSCTGRLGKDPEMRFVPSGTAVATLRLAVNLAQEKTLWFKVTVWGKQAENANQYLKKGSRIAVSGRLDLEEWTSDDGTPRSAITIVANDIRYLDTKKDSEGSTSTTDSLVDSTASDDNDANEFPL